MFSDFLKAKKIEIVVKKVNDLYQAACSIFPESIGVGNNEQEAIENLADLIIGRVDAVIKETLKDVLKESISRKLKDAKRVVVKSKSHLGSRPELSGLKANLSSLDKKKRLKKSKTPGKFTFDLPLRTDLIKGDLSGEDPLVSKYGMVVLGLRPMFVEDFGKSENLNPYDLMNEAGMSFLPGLLDMDKIRSRIMCI